MEVEPHQEPEPHHPKNMTSSVISDICYTLNSLLRKLSLGKSVDCVMWEAVVLY